MKKYYKYLLLFVVLSNVVTINLNAQKSLFKEGVRLYSLHNYRYAIYFLKKVYLQDVSNAHISYLLGVSYLHLDKLDSALYYLNKAKDKVSFKYNEYSFADKSAPTKAFYYLGKVFHKQLEFDKAMEWYTKFLNFAATHQDTVLAQRMLECTMYAKKAIADSVKIKITNLGPNVNSPYNDYAPAIDSSQSILIFTSRRKGNLGEKTEYGDFPDDLYVSYNKKGKWTKAVPLSKTINTVYDEASISISPDATHLFIFKNTEGSGDIYESFYKDSMWTKPIKLPKGINTKYNETHASITSDESELYFVSDRPGGYGGKDIYYCVLLPNGEWSKPKNIGNVINTQYDEDAVFIHPDGQTIYFSSKGHDNFGGYDLFYSNRNPDGSWSKPKNFGYPINTPNDENFFVITPDNHAAYFSASYPNRGYGQRDIYKMDLLSMPGRYETVVKGFIISEQDNGKIIKDNFLEVYDKNNKLIGRYKPDNTGQYTIILNQNNTYVLKVKYNNREYSSELFVPDKTSYFLTEKPYNVTPLITIQ